MATGSVGELIMLIKLIRSLRDRRGASPNVVAARAWCVTRPDRM